jgi:FOG: WD40 repeat
VGDGITTGLAVEAIYRGLVPVLFVLMSAVQAMEDCRAIEGNRVPTLKELVLKKIVTNPRVYASRSLALPIDLQADIRAYWACHDDDGRIAQWYRALKGIGPVTFEGKIVLSSHDACEEVVIHDQDNFLSVFDKAMYRMFAVGHFEDRVMSVLFDQFGNKIVTASDDHTVDIVSMGGVFITRLVGHTHRVQSAVLNALGNRIITMSWESAVKLWDIQGNCLKTLCGLHGGGMFNASGDRIVVFSRETAYVWDLLGHCLVTLSGHNHWIRSVTFNSVGDKIITVSYDGVVKVWHEKGRCLITLIPTLGYQDHVNIALFNPQGDQIITASQNGMVRMWDMQGNCIVTLSGHDKRVNHISCNGAGDKIVTVSDNVVKLWDIHGNCLATLLGHANVIDSLFFNQVGDQIITASQDGTVKIWDVADLLHINKKIMSLSIEQLLLFDACKKARGNSQQLLFTKYEQDILKTMPPIMQRVINELSLSWYEALPACTIV